MTLRHIVLLFTTLLVVFSEGRAVGIERVAKKNGVFEAADIGAVGKKVLGILDKAPVKADIISEFGVKIQSNVDDILAVFPNESTHLFYQKLIGRSDEIHEAILNNVGDIGLRSADDLTVFFDDIAASGADLMEAFATNPNLVKSWEGLFGHPSFRTITVDLETVANYYTRTGKSVDDFVDELFTDPAHMRIWLDDLADNIYRLTFKQIDDYVTYSTKQGNQSKVMFGMWDNGEPTGYIAQAGNNHTYFDMGSKWDEAKALVQGGTNDWADEMWEINKKFIDNQKSAGKEFWFSHDPYSPL